MIGGDRLIGFLVVVAPVAAGCVRAPQGRPPSTVAVAVASKETLPIGKDSEALLERRCAGCHEKVLPGRPSFTTIAGMTEDISRRSVERVTDGTMPPGEPLSSSEARKLGLGLCARVAISPALCTERYFGQIGPLTRTVAETLREIDSFAPRVPDASKDQREAIENIESELRKHNLPHRATARLDPTFVVLYTLLARERCASLIEVAPRQSCETKILSVGLGKLPPPPGSDE